ncbi:WxL domain-containing protein [Enterococcus faecium]|uniref:WxL domain-containing protein n=1 Tax=Enterococcus faecium TaxID=1352 RepID=UPI002810815B|nr:WxL domain-containing protein [Enterococcus faecium]MDQ8465914.1 WxL domain-containing protein [Enterococcus faecium]
MSTTLLGAGGVFADTSQPTQPDPADARTQISTVLTINEHPTAPEPPKNPDGGTDQETGITGLFGIAYTPKALSGTAQLQDSGRTEVPLSNNTATNDQNKYNVGVQDKTRGKDRNWTLKAQLEWTGDEKGYMTGSTIEASEGNVKLNNGSGALTPVTEEEVTIGNQATNLSISNVPVTLMQAHPDKVVNGVYNYQFKDPKLVIPKSEGVTADTYSGNIVWNLSNALGE